MRGVGGRRGLFRDATPGERLDGRPTVEPSSTEAVRAQLPDVPFDSLRPLCPFGHGLRYG